MDNKVFQSLLYQMVIVKGISKKSGRSYEMLGISRDGRFNPTVIEVAKGAGVREIDTTPKQ